MNLLGIVASEMESGGGGTNVLPFVLIGAAIVVAVVVQRSRMQQAKSRVTVRRRPDDGRVELSPPAPSQPHSLSVGVRLHRDDNGVQTLLEGAT